MSDVMEEYSKWREEMAAKKFALKLWEDGICDFERISKLTDLPLDEVKELLKDKTA